MCCRNLHLNPLGILHWSFWFGRLFFWLPLFSIREFQNWLLFPVRNHCWCSTMSKWFYSLSCSFYSRCFFLSISTRTLSCHLSILNLRWWGTGLFIPWMCFLLSGATWIRLLKFVGWISLFVLTEGPSKGPAASKSVISLLIGQLISQLMVWKKKFLQLQLILPGASVLSELFGIRL